MEPGEKAGPRLPIPRTSFIGRSAELDQIRKLLAAGSMVTLTGSAGSGKTLLALEAARQSSKEGPHEVSAIDLCGREGQR